MKRKGRFTCSPKAEPFCCYTERITLLPSEVRKHKEGWENGGLLVPMFRGVFKKEFVSRKKIGSVEQVDLVELEQMSLLVRMELVFFPLVPVEELSDSFRKHLRGLDLNGNLVFKCPFLKDGRCSIYKEKPLFCRLFPISVHGPLGEHRKKCFECGGPRVFEGRSVNKQIQLNKTEVLRRRKDIEEWKKIVRELFNDKYVVLEALGVMNEARRDRSFLFSILHNPDLMTSFTTVIPKVYDYFGIDIDNQIRVAEKAWKLAEEYNEPVFARDYRFLYNSLKRAAVRWFEKNVARELAEMEMEKLLAALRESALP